MSQVEEVMDHPEIKVLVAHDEEYAHKIRSCIEGLIREGAAETETLVQATKKALNAITDRLQVFLSYKRDQHAAFAMALREALQGFGGAKIDVFLDEVKIQSGQDWFNSIKKSLKRANCLVLLVPDDSDEREWPIFEAAFFAGRMLPGERLICLHHPDVHIPRQLTTFQGIKADASGIEKLLHVLLVESDVVPGCPAINPDCAPFLKDYGWKLAEKFSGPIRLKARTKMNFIKLKLSKPGQFSDKQDLLRSTIVDARGLSEMFFFTGECPCELQEVLSVQGGDVGRHDVWLTELTECVREEIAKRRGELPFAKFSTPDGRQVFRPVLRELEEDQAGVVHRIEIIFGEHLTGITEDPDDLQIIEAGLRLAARLRAEILCKLAQPRKTEHVERVERILKRIEREAYDDGFRDRLMLTQLFNADDRKIVDGMYDNWEKNYRNPQGTGKLDVAFAKKDYGLLRKALDEIRIMNLDFSTLTAHRYVEMLNNEPRH